VGKTKIIAEIGINHEGSIDIARLLIESAYKAGCDAIKFQYRNLTRAYTSASAKEIGDGLLQSEINRCYLTPEEIIILANESKNEFHLKAGISFFTSEDILDFGDSISIFDFFKVPSVEFCNENLINKLYSYRKLVALSLGCLNESEISKRLPLLDKERTVLMHCVSNYPVEIYNSKLGYISHLKKIWPHQVGYSSHDLDWRVCIAALSIGVNWIERHITLDKKSWGLDHSTSSTPDEFKDLCFFSKEMDLAMTGNAPRSLNSGEMINLQNLGRSPYLVLNKNKGEKLCNTDIKWRSPQIGLSSSNFQQYFEKKLTRDVKKGDSLCSFHFENQHSKYSFDKKWLSERKISLPVRIHDSNEIFVETGVTYQELHLSFIEVLSSDLLIAENYSPDRKYSIHLPDYINSNTIIDPFSSDNSIKSLSIKIINNCIELSKLLYSITKNQVPIVGSFSKRHSSKLNDIKEVNDFCRSNSINKINILMPQWLPPIAWYFGGSVRLELFNSIEDLEIMKEVNCIYCLDISHAFMCSFLEPKVLYLMCKSFDLAKHIHLAGASCIDGEGEPLSKLSKEQKEFFNQVIKLPYIKVIEVWQGHLNNYLGFKQSLLDIKEITY
tara:strand:+ start:26887 stop:28719 length:1833 start_codon:yes stop_codon:yes gene_type:complete